MKKSFVKTKTKKTNKLCCLKSAYNVLSQCELMLNETNAGKRMRTKHWMDVHYNGYCQCTRFCFIRFSQLSILWIFFFYFVIFRCASDRTEKIKITEIDWKSNSLHVRLKNQCFVCQIHVALYRNPFSNKIGFRFFFFFFSIWGFH